MKMVKIMRRFAGLAGAWLLAGVIGGTAAASTAYPELTVTQKGAFERTVAAASAEKSARLLEQHQEYEVWRQQAKDWERKTADLHDSNEQAETALRKKIREVDAGPVTRAKQAYEGTKERYQRLFDLSRSVNLQLQAARKIKNKTVTAVLQAEADSLKIPVALARHDIRLKEEAYQEAKKTAYTKMKKIRDTLSGITPVEIQIRAAKRAVGAPRDSRWTVWKSFTHALTKKDAVSASSLLGSVNALSRQISERLQKIHELELRAAGIIRLAEAQWAQSHSA